MKRLVPVLLWLLLMSLAFSCVDALAEDTEAQNITKKCTIKVSTNQNYRIRMTDAHQTSCWPCHSGDAITVKGPKDGRLVQGFEIDFASEVPTVTVTAMDGETLAVWNEPYRNGYVALSHPSDGFTITLTYEDPTLKLRVSTLRLYGEGELPGTVQRWRMMEGKADLMLIACHPDDELIWFGGLLPTYAGEKQKKVIVVNMSPEQDARVNELLDGLWTCGVRDYPVIGTLAPIAGYSIRKVLDGWGEDGYLYVTRQIRKYQPDVIVTHDVDGEYGHGAHRATVRILTDLLPDKLADPTYDPESAAEYGTWVPKKVYLHTWQEGQIVMDWRQPLAAFGGETSLEVGRRAFKKHVSQQDGQYALQTFGAYDCRKFGLYYTTVGPDVKGDDFLENID